MNTLLKKIFDEFLSEEKDVIESGNQIDNEITNLIEPYKNKLSDNEIEELKTLLHQASYIGKLEGFRLGIKYMFKIVVILLS